MRKNELKNWTQLRKEVLSDPEVLREYNKLPPVSIAAEIIRARHEKGITQEEFASLAGLKQPAVARLENPNNKGYSLKTLQKIANALGATLEIKFKLNQ